MYFQRGAAKGFLDESAPLTGPPRPLGLSKFVSCHQCFFFVVGIASTCRNKCKFSLHNFCWAGNAYFSTQTVFTTIFFSPLKKHTNFPDFGRNFETQNTNGPPHFSVSCDNRPTKDCRTMLRFSLGFLVQEIRGKNRGVPPGPYAAPPPICTMES